MAGQIPCTCGCGQEVTYATKHNHLNGSGKIVLRTRVVAEGKSLNTQEQKPTPLLKGSKKRASSNPDQNDSCKWCKAAQLKNQLPEITSSSQVDTDLMDDLHPPIAADTDRQSRFIERSQGVMGIRWMSSRWHLSSHFDDGKGRDNDGRDDGDEDKDMVKENEDKDEDEDGDGDGDEDRDEDEDGDEDEDEEYKDRDKEEKNKPPFCDSEIPGISNWDLLGKDFEHEAAALGLYSLYER